MTSSETRALTHAALLVLGLGLLRVAAEGIRHPVSTQGANLPDSSGLAELLHESKGSREEAQRRATPLIDGERIDPNTAGEEDLDRLPGVGPALASRIVRMRVDSGPFNEASDLLLVQGVGPTTLAKIIPYLEMPAEPVRSRAGRDASARPLDPVAGSTSGGLARVDLNGASRADLERLPGVGPVTAERILALRDERGRFLSLEELRSVRGIGAATIERLRPVLVIGR